MNEQLRTTEPMPDSDSPDRRDIRTWYTRDVAALLAEIDRLRQREIDLCAALDVEGACPDDCIGKVRR